MHFSKAHFKSLQDTGLCHTAHLPHRQTDYKTVAVVPMHLTGKHILTLPDVTHKAFIRKDQTKTPHYVQL